MARKSYVQKANIMEANKYFCAPLTTLATPELTTTQKSSEAIKRQKNKSPREET